MLLRVNQHCLISWTAYVQALTRPTAMTHVKCSTVEWCRCLPCDATITYGTVAVQEAQSISRWYQRKHALKAGHFMYPTSGFSIKANITCQSRHSQQAHLIHAGNEPTLSASSQLNPFAGPPPTLAARACAMLSEVIPLSLAMWNTPLACGFSKASTYASAASSTCTALICMAAVRAVKCSSWHTQPTI